MQFFRDLRSAHHTISIKTDRRYFFRILPLLWLERIAFLTFCVSAALSLIGLVFRADFETSDLESDLIHLGTKVVILFVINILVCSYAEPKDYNGGGMLLIGAFVLVAFVTRLGVEQRFGLDRILFSFEDIPDIFSLSSPVMTIIALVWLVMNLILCCISVHHYRRTQVEADKPAWEF